MEGERCFKVESFRVYKRFCPGSYPRIAWQKGISDAVVNMGNSSIMAIGDVPVKLNDGCLTTSGNPPGRPCQIVNPITGGLVMSPGRVEVASRSGAEGEVLSTVLFAAGADPEYEELLRSRFTIYRITRYF